MRFSITKLCGVFFALGLMLAQSCSHLTEELPIPASDQSQSIIAKAQFWFNQTEQGSSSLRQSKGSVIMSWQLAVTSGDYVVVPLADTTNLFGSVQKHGYRYLVVQNASSSDLKGRIVELILAGPLLSHRRAAEAALAVAKPFLQHNSPAPANVPGLTGYALIYSAAYYYQAGMEYEQGVVLNKRVSLRLERKSKDADATALKVDTPATASFIDNASFCMVITTCGTVTVGEGNGGSNCISYPVCIDLGNGSSGGGDGGGWGGDGGGGGADPTPPPPLLTPDMVLVNRPDVPVPDIKQYLKCFDTNAPATLTVYARQPVPGTNDTYIFNGVLPDVEHSFISISQNGITRVFGFYPSSSVSFKVDAPGMWGNNSLTPYTGSASTEINGGNLWSLLQYINSVDGKDYKLATFNCTDFAIGAAHAAGVDLPDTWGRWGGISGGSNPGDLGNDLNTKSLPSGAQRGGSGLSPANKGGC